MATRRKPFITKPGKYGTLYRYEVSIVDSSDDDNPQAFRTWAYDGEHAEERFWETQCGDDGWTITGIKRVRHTSASLDKVPR